MIRKTIIISILFFIIFEMFCISHSHTYSTSPPLGRTGAPVNNGLTCASSGCHSGAPLSGQGLEFLLDGHPASTYEAGKVYDVTLNINNIGNRYGFEMLAIDENVFNAGTFIADGVLHQVSTDGNGLNYIHHLNAPNPSSQNSFTFQWKAPDNNAAKINFYVSGMAANGNGDYVGDVIYNDVFSLDLLTGIEDTQLDRNANLSINVYPNPLDLVNEKLNIIFKNTQPYKINDIQTIKIFNTEGKQLFEQTLNGIQQHPPVSIIIDLNPTTLKRGLYFVSIEDKNQKFVHKLFIK